MKLGDYTLEDEIAIPNRLADLAEDATHRTVTDTEKSTWNGKQTALGFTAENVANKQTDLTASATKYPTVNAVIAYLIANYRPLGNHYTNTIVIEGLATSYGNEETIFINSADADPFTIPMPDPAAMFGVRLTVYVLAVGDGSILLDFAGKLDGSLDVTLTSADIGKSMMIISNGTFWYNHKSDLL